jgi:hypothetical protein
MTDIWSATKTALTGLNLPMAANQYLVATGSVLPDAFLVYQVISDPAAQHADNAETLRQYRIQVTYCSRTGLPAIPAIEGAMKTAGFTRLPGRELPYNQDTRHFGFALDFSYLDEE